MNLISYSMFLHAEHHLFPAVPTAHLTELARRLDKATAVVSRREVLSLESVLPKLGRTVETTL